MKKVSLEEVWQLAGDAECPVIEKVESAPMEAAVCLKQLPKGYMLGLSDKSDALELWYSTDLADARQMFEEKVDLMNRAGTPLANSKT